MMKTYPGFTVQANGIQIHYYRSTPPGGGPAIVFIHGLTDNGLCWARVAGALEGSYDLVMPDTRGHGLSEKPPSGYSVKERAADVAGLIDALALDRPVLLGHSLGGETAIATAALYPQKVRAVILEDPALFSGEGTREGREESAQRWLSDLVRQQSLEQNALQASCCRENPSWPADEVSAWALAKRQMSGEALVSILSSMAGTWQELVQKADCPILLVTAEPGKGIITPEMAQEASGLWKQGQVANIREAGHSIHREQFNLYMEKVQAFLQTLP